MEVKKKLLDIVRDTICFKHYKKHPKDMGKAEIEEYLTSLAIENKVASFKSFISYK